MVRVRAAARATATANREVSVRRLHPPRDLSEKDSALERLQPRANVLGREAVAAAWSGARLDALALEARVRLVQHAVDVVGVAAAGPRRDVLRGQVELLRRRVVRELGA